MNTSFAIEPADLFAGRMWVRFLNSDGTEPEAQIIQKVMTHEYNDDNMVGRGEMQIAREPEGWRVIEAVLISEGGTDRSDHRTYVIAALREAGVRLAHPEPQGAYVYNQPDGSIEVTVATEVHRLQTVADAADLLAEWLTAREGRYVYFGLPSGESMDGDIRRDLEKALNDRGVRLRVTVDTD